MLLRSFMYFLKGRKTENDKKETLKFLDYINT